jgi:hypothetical protein
MATSQPKQKPRRSRRSGVKKAKLIKSNIEVLKNISNESTTTNRF